MNIAILLPYKENYSSSYPGAVSIFISSVIKKSNYKNQIVVYGSTNYKNILTKNYINIKLNKNLFSSQTKIYLASFKKLLNTKKTDLIEIHNRPNYVDSLLNLKKKIVLYFHNDPTTMLGSTTISDRIKLINNCSKIIFNSNWSKKKFLTNLPINLHYSSKLIVIYQSINKKKIDLNKKEKIITFVGKLNSSKGYDLFGKAVIKILNKFPEWKGLVIGDEIREKYNFSHKNLNILGFVNHKNVLKFFEKSSIAIVCSRWEEPFGRTSLEASSRGCAVIISNRGGLPETIKDPIILKKLTVDDLYKEIKKLITDKKKLITCQKKSLKYFYLDDKFISKQIDSYRNDLFRNKKVLQKNKKLKILHVTNFNERHNGRLFYNTGRRINNGLIRLNHSVLELSDRDIISYSRKFNDITGSKNLNKKFLNIVETFRPELIIFGHADLINLESLKYIKKNYPNIKMCQWFLDRMDSEWKINLKRFKEKINYLDKSFCTTDPRNLKIKNLSKIKFMPNPVDPSLDRLDNSKNKILQNDIFFAMSHGVHRGVLKKGKIDRREIIITQLLKKLPNIKFDIYGMSGIEPIWSEEYLKALSNCKIGLNLSQGSPGKYYSSDRFSQLIGNGLMVMIDEKTQIGNFFKKDEIVLYKNLKDLIKKINFYNKHDNLRKKIAKKGRKKYFKYFNSKIVAEFIVNKTFNITKKYYWEKFLY